MSSEQHFLDEQGLQYFWSKTKSILSALAYNGAVNQIRVYPNSRLAKYGVDVESADDGSITLDGTLARSSTTVLVQDLEDFGASAFYSNTHHALLPNTDYRLTGGAPGVSIQVVGYEDETTYSVIKSTQSSDTFNSGTWSHHAFRLAVSANAVLDSVTIYPACYTDGLHMVLGSAPEYAKTNHDLTSGLLSVEESLLTKLSNNEVYGGSIPELQNGANVDAFTDPGAYLKTASSTVEGWPCAGPGRLLVIDTRGNAPSSCLQIVLPSAEQDGFSLYAREYATSTWGSWVIIPSAQRILQMLYGLGTLIAPASGETDDMDNYTSPGTYRVQNSTYSARITNAPVKTAGYTFRVSSLNADGYVRQEAYVESRPGEIFIRHLRGPSRGWTNWWSFSGVEQTPEET